MLSQLSLHDEQTAAKALQNLRPGLDVWLSPSSPTSPSMTSEPSPRSPSLTCPQSHKCSLAFILSDPAPAEEHEEISTEEEDESKPRALKHKRRAPTGSKSKYCIVEGCTSRAKHARRCWRHGGSVKCKVPECINRAKSRGVCWSHGGGTTCTHPDCGTIAVSHGFCWAHGGGKRCQVSGCSRPAYERTQNFCSMHFKQGAESSD
ncbi:hypothetical protein Poli38472_014696 [Pythium oligandrum]|uniref:WRKY19-like zinc finger domain-containing protein n=1 Tax=Pythium oligandrum TaxID=41045 RepID=A0A8K1FIM7_PYTOL|nr:hypothetical protein Poli38472_014696 [Pythium oligandrum]|eukprot:TMW63991.1 hypothetical protein Poli38472_014696 [Pythium oligandrum]